MRLVKERQVPIFLLPTWNSFYAATKMSAAANKKLAMDVYLFLAEAGSAPTHNLSPIHNYTSTGRYWVSLVSRTYI